MPRRPQAGLEPGLLAQDQAWPADPRAVLQQIKGGLCFRVKGSDPSTSSIHEVSLQVPV